MDIIMFSGVSSMHSTCDFVTKQASCRTDLAMIGTAPTVACFITKSHVECILLTPLNTIISITFHLAKILPITNPTSAIYKPAAALTRRASNLICLCRRARRNRHLYQHGRYLHSGYSNMTLYVHTRAHQA